MQKTLTSVAACVPVAMQLFGDAPVSLIVFAGPTPNAPEVRCRHRLHAEVPVAPQPVLNPEQSESEVQAVASQLPPPLTHALRVDAVLQMLPFSDPPLQTPRKSEVWLPLDLPQNPQKT